ncbi:MULTISPECIES: winged helix-turn-helix domain-containing protein [Brevibacillus]|nr:helix-turn-helix domain-containing protein [Brevibacillus borstelensis]KKX53451.1 transcriptional regulator [Brevibacillus borstelensis cifa_chp40]MBE5393962.1 helix-turn-helix transcriptional regulator [Brevibacillus borstelensis]NOU54395.1 helix-turn-helix transcriptional regulator [Brevibacillus borstelensis]RNB59252.1 ArsR family transcriptional regulator [Brevibacillus borstelensis]WNF04808.1 helix-turn-helix domain-containing protein [Brevibacillus borstelensis]
MKEFFNVTDPEALKSLAIPERVKILELFEDLEPRTAKQIATELGENAARLHYHVKELVRVGLLQQVDTRVKGSIVEKYYEPVAKVIQVKLRLMIEENAQQLSDIMFTPFRTTEKDLVRTLNRFVASDVDVRKEYKDTFAYNLTEFYLSQEERNELVAEISDLLQKYKGLKNENGRRKFKFFDVLFPVTPPDPSEDDEDDDFEDNEA